jgi:imidazolonepropionase-like amidohydrolase
VGSSLASLDRMQQQGGGGELLTGVYGTGPMFGPPGGYPGRIWPEKYGLPVTDERSGREEAENVLARGASMLKIGFEPGPNPDKPWPMLCLDAAKGIVAAAHEQGVVVRCHVQDLSGLELAIDVGVDCVEHTVLRSARGPVCVGAPGRKMPGAAYATGLHRLADAGIMLVPTLQMAARAAWDGTGALGAVRLFRAAGGVVGLGTDAPMRGVQHGMPLEEMRLLGLAGLDNEAILHAATLGAAKALGQARERGSLEPGKVADLLVLQQDPAMDISVCALPDLIMKEGKIFHAA